MNIILTELAITKIKEIAAAECIQEIYIRIGIVGGGCQGFQFTLDFSAAGGENDIQVEYNGINIVIDSISIMYLDGINIDYIETPMAAGFKFSGGEIKSTCGCGSSVSM